ncbi:hypothetical protein BDQ12DRAFT_677735 [Crucibulum laeve]|uniref:Uncharacterized protein n=1 Tax=Crucibulum laeve TaxID=68775 RepID=A0A5C3ME84_9AGAR|nr:hypothetical protein BDQ12DRAFT_677735 [Crucibulum laeve]
MSANHSGESGSKPPLPDKFSEVTVSWSICWYRTFCIAVASFALLHSTTVLLSQHSVCAIRLAFSVLSVSA